MGATPPTPPTPPPPTSAPPPQGPHGFERGAAGGRLNRWLLLGLFVGILGAVLVVAAVLLSASEPDAAPPRCEGPACDPITPPSDPPTLSPGATPSPSPSATPDGPLAPRLVAGELVQSADIGYQLDVNTAVWQVTANDGRNVEMQIPNPDFRVFVSIEGVPAGEAEPQALVDAKVDELSEDVLGLAAVSDAAQVILTPAVGYRSGVGGVFGGTTDTPQGPGSPVSVVVMAASDGQTSVVMTVITDDAVRLEVFGLVDEMMNSFRFASEIIE